ncbi:hypothetical protein [Anaerobutyricum hallii]|mgnify:FL=1|jgi:hypothetical protein|uniref:hypothetical protein n=1 Tax=Anaerobutyricum hallii TaxID=39488 RepID=UPI002432B4E4|nr:hypothetical protein [Anaerobutyricum hallii]
MIERILKSENIPYKLIDEDKGLKIVKVNGKLHILYLYGKGNKFLMERDFFDYLDSNAIPYSVLCNDTISGKMYYIKLNKNVNWIKSCFETCDKDAIYLGKQVLNVEISEETLRKELKRELR